MIIMNYNFLLLPLLAAAILTCCTGEDIGLLQRAEAYLPQHPDSAQACLDSIIHPDHLNASDHALYGLLRTIADNRQGKSVASDSLIRDSYEYYREASNAGQTTDTPCLHHYAQSCYYMGLFYHSCDSTKQCEDLFRQAVKSGTQCEDWRTCYLAYTMLSIVILWSNIERAIEHSKKALEVYHKINDDVNNEVLILGQVAGDYLAAADYDNALKYYYRAYKLAKENNLVQSLKEISMGIGGTYLYMGGHNEEALKYVREGIIMGDSVPAITSQMTLAETYMACDSLSQAKDILYMLLEKKTAPLTRYIIFRNLTGMAVKAHDDDSLFVYIDSAYTCMEQRYLHALHVKDEYYQANIEKELQKEKIQYEATLHKWILGAIILFLVLLFLFTYHVVRNRVAIERQKRMNNVLARQFERSQHLEEQRRKESVIREHQQAIQHQQEIIRQKAITLSVIQKHLMEKLEHIAGLMAEKEKVKMTEEAWREIEHLINDTDGNFVQKLRQQHRDFKEEDIQLCMLTRLRMTNATIANIYHIGISAVKKRKLALKKTGFQITDPAISLEQVIENL